MLPCRYLSYTCRSHLHASHISCLFSLAVKPAEFAEFKALIATIVAATRAEPGTLVYEYSVNEDNSTVHILERYNVDAVVSHVDTTFAPFGQRFLGCAPSPASWSTAPRRRNPQAPGPVRRRLHDPIRRFQPLS
jgi:quinol monooxygenase YgiN